jgi:hypothetical protein
MTSYKKEDGVTDIILPEGIQSRNSEHRVRCIYNPTPPEETTVETGSSRSPYVLRAGSRKEKSEGLLPSTLNNYESVSSLPQNPKYPPQ